MTKMCAIFVLFFAVGATSSAAIAEDPRLLGDWGGLQPFLTKNGVEMEAVVTLDSLSVVDGGVEEGSAILGNVDLTATMDTEKMGLWSGGTIFLYGLGNFGDSISELVGDSQVTSNIETFGTVKLYEAWYEQSLITDRLSVLVGLHDYNSEFNALDNASYLINSSFGIEPDISQVGPSIFSTTALGIRLRMQPTEELYVLGASYDGVPGDPEDASGTHIRFDSGDGFFHALEAGWASGEDAAYRKVALGGWYHTKDFEDVNGVPRDDNSGFYFIAEMNPTDSIGLFFQYGRANPNRNEVKQYFGGGLRVNGLAESRADDVLSLGLASSHYSDDARAADGRGGSETALELQYRIQVSPFFAFSPDVQIVFNPSGDTTVDDAIQIGFRTELAL